MRFYGYTVFGTGSATHGLTFAPGASATDDGVQYEPGQPYLLRGHAPDWYGEVVGGPLFSRGFGTPGGGATSTDLGDPTMSPQQNNIWDWMTWVTARWPNPHTAPFDDARPLSAILTGDDATHPRAAVLTVGDYRWTTAVRALLAIYELRVAFPDDGIAPWVTLHYLRDAIDWEVFQWVHLRMVDMGVRRGILFAGNTNFSVHYPSGFGPIQADLLVELFASIRGRMATHCVAP
jgi:hypothetical protein